ncbi:hypothetical protein D3C75_879160 [compost metagenome]
MCMCSIRNARSASEYAMTSRAISPGFPVMPLACVRSATTASATSCFEEASESRMANVPFFKIRLVTKRYCNASCSFRAAANPLNQMRRVFHRFLLLSCSGFLRGCTESLACSETRRVPAAVWLISSTSSAVSMPNLVCALGAVKIRYSARSYW